jgi:lipopolysaccharide/colanic/teichoic acid biosynthesis glycosyltransferase
MGLNYRFMKRIFDFVTALLGLIILSPVLSLILLAIWLQDFKSPFYISDRVGKNEKLFKLIKLRSMVVGADRKGIDSTSANDSRITTVGKNIRKYKLDELSQLFNVVKGDMSLVGPRPNVKRETDIYTVEEKKLLTVQPGITDFASIVFADEAEILANERDTDIAYNQLIRPGKSRLGLFYIEHQSLILDLKIILLTVVAILSRDSSLRKLCNLLEKIGANNELLSLASRKHALIPTPPPGANKIVTSRFE